jgi:erythromycin esterase
MVRSIALRALFALGLILASAGLSLGAGAEDRQVAWLKKEAVALRSIEPGDEDFSDLEPLRSLLADKRIVILGEASHGDGSTFLAKSRLVRFLHREMGFDVLAFESGFYDCWKAWQRIQAGEDPATAFRQSVFPIWSKSAQVQSLISYFAAAARSPRPLELAGVDLQFTGEMAKRLLDEDLKRLAVAAGMPAEELSARVSGPLTNLVEGSYETGEIPPAAARAELVKAFEEVARRLREVKEPSPEQAFWLRFAESTRQLATNSWSTDWNRPPLEDPDSFAVRDRVMGENLVWLARHRFPGRKIVVWAASFHSAREVDEIDVPSPPHMRLFRTLQPMGAVARRELKEQVYTVAVLAYQGRYILSNRPIEIWQPSAGSLEDLFHRTGLPYAFLDLSRTGRLPGWLRDPQVARPMGYKEMKAPWGRVFDAILFIDRMAMSEKASSEKPTP